MNLLEKIRNLFHKEKEAAMPEPLPVQPAERPKKTCKKCGKTFSYDASWDFIPNYCKDCKQQFAREKEEKQRAGAPRKIKRKCKECGNFFTFPSTLPHYPNYCSNCRKRHQAAMKEKYGAKGRKQQTGNKKQPAE